MSDSKNNISGAKVASAAGQIVKAGAGAGILLAILSRFGRFADHAEAPAENVLAHLTGPADRTLGDASHAHPDAWGEMFKDPSPKGSAEVLNGSARSTEVPGRITFSPTEFGLASRVALLLSKSEVMHHKLQSLSNNPRMPVWQYQQLKNQLDNNDSALQSLKTQSVAQPNDPALQQQIDQAGADQQHIGQQIDELYNEYG